MRQRIRRAIRTASVLALVALSMGKAEAATIVQFSYSGRGVPGFEGIFCNGNGSFSSADDLSTVGLADLTSFSFSMEETAQNSPSNSVTFGLTDLKDFSATLGAGPSLTSLSLDTGPVQGTDNQTEPRGFSVSALGDGGASTSYYLSIFGPFELTAGTVTITSVVVPEPPAITLAALALLMIAGGQPLRRKLGAVA